jgi:Peptidase family M1 domain/Peptidase M1 N-terminal domain/Immune inhibitor A-like, MAM domain
MSFRIRFAALIAAAFGILALPALASANNGGKPDFAPGAAGAGDPYFPLDGNGGYDTRHYLLDVKYDPDTDVLEGRVTIKARATQDLSSFNLDLVGLTVRSVRVDGRWAAWTRDEHELTITPKKGIRNGRRFVVEIRYDGIPEPVDEFGGGSGFIATDDGALVAGQPHVAATWYPVNDHPSDKASYTFEITVPQGLEAVANGELEKRWTKQGWTTWLWDAKVPMASYLTTATIGEFAINAYKKKGIRFWDAVDPDLYEPPAAPRTGSQFAISQRAEPSYKRLQRTIAVPAGGADMTFWVTRDTETNWDFLFVEAHTAGQDDWTTLPDVNGHTSGDTGFVCPFWFDLHPFLEHYQTAEADGSCSPSGTTGEWNAVSGRSEGYEQWRVDLSAYAGKNVVVSISYASDDFFQYQGVFVDDIVVSAGAGTTSFENDGNTMDGWTVPGPPAGSPPNDNDWIVGTAADTPTPVGVQIDASFAMQPEILDFLASRFGKYPFSASGGIVDDYPSLGFALENQTRPIYAIGFFFDPRLAVDVVVHELAHQWYGDSVAVAAWQHIWLNEGFATYAEWLWNEDIGNETAQESFEFFYDVVHPADDPWWELAIGDPGVDHLFDDQVYTRGAMTLHALRLTVGDRDFFRILRRWAHKKEGGNGTTDEFIALAERVSGEDLGDLFDAWLFTPARPDLPTASAARALSRSSAAVASVNSRQLELRR